MDDNQNDWQPAPPPPAPPTIVNDIGDNRALTVKQYVGYLLLFNFVPIVGLIMALVWAFGEGGSAAKKTFCKGWLLYYLILQIASALICFFFVLLIVMFSISGVHAFSSLYM